MSGCTITKKCLDCTNRYFQDFQRQYLENQSKTGYGKTAAGLLAEADASRCIKFPQIDVRVVYIYPEASG